MDAGNEQASVIATTFGDPLPESYVVGVTGFPEDPAAMTRSTDGLFEERAGGRAGQINDRRYPLLADHLGADDGASGRVVDGGRYT